MTLKMLEVDHNRSRLEGSLRKRWSKFQATLEVMNSPVKTTKPMVRVTSDTQWTRGSYSLATTRTPCKLSTQ